jgi:hypothetical protein
MILVQIFQNGMNLGQFRFEVDPTQTPAWLRLEHRVHSSGRLQGTWRAAATLWHDDRAVGQDGGGGTDNSTSPELGWEWAGGRLIGCRWPEPIGLRTLQKEMGRVGE